MGLEPFEEHDVIASGVEMPGASGGLNKALAVNELEHHHGDRVILAIDATVVKVRFDEVPDTNGCLQRVHVLRVNNAVPISAKAVERELDRQQDRRDKAAGITKLPGITPEAQEDPDAPDTPED
jgi:hypothetical protein